jgi:hypothetical protein
VRGGADDDHHDIDHNVDDVHDHHHDDPGAGHVCVGGERLSGPGRHLRRQ